MPSATTFDLMERARERAKTIGFNLRQKDKAIRKCPKCGSVFFGKVCLHNEGGSAPDIEVGVFCANCGFVYDTEEVKIG